MHWGLIVASVALVVLGVGACATSSGNRAAGKTDGAEAAPGPSSAAGAARTRPPLMISEAELPQGFPPVGPIGKVVVKEYPAYRLARVTSDRSGPNAMFNPLFRHIQRNEIPMTAPVEMTYARPGPAGAATGRGDAGGVRGGTNSMAFLYQAPDVGRTGPDVVDPRVVVEDVPPMTVLSVAVRGDYTWANFDRGLTQLETWLAENPGQVRVVGAPRYLAYNSPFVPWFLKVGEVQYPVERLDRVARP